MDQKSRGRDLFIVDNSVSGWTGLRYLEEWTGIAKGFDIATGNFEIGALLALDGKWQQLDREAVAEGSRRGEQLISCLLQDWPCPPRTPRPRIVCRRMRRKRGSSGELLRRKMKRTPSL